MFSPVNHFEPIQLIQIEKNFQIFSIDNMSLTIILTFLFLNFFLIYTLSHKPIFLNKSIYFIERFFYTFLSYFNEKPFIIYRGLIPFYMTLFLSLATFNLITLIIPLFYPLATQFFITFYLSGLIIGNAFLILIYRYRGLVWYGFTVNSNVEIISIFLFFNEIFSFIMRFFSLGGRLALNMFSGHLLLFLITNVSFHLYNHFGFTFWLISLPLVLFIHILELFVAVLQAYVFTYLSIYYFREASGL